ncbi:MAG TPA: GAF domain-containing sensor histidine kinase [Patescibacteria group bacterium]|nr:GAF domain-containing sensor histidine kinase [Patescibacteria group bacterium]
MSDNVLAQINTSALKFLSPLTTEETFKIVVSEAEKIMGGEYGTIVLEERGELHRVYADADFFATFQPKKRGLTYTTLEQNQPRILDVAQEKNLHKKILEQGIKTIIHIPLSYKEKRIGVLSIHTKNSLHVSDNDMHLYSLYGALASMAIRKTQLYAETKNALETRDLFISLASHELRTPLTSLNGYIHLLQNKLTKTNSIEKKWIDELAKESSRLTNLIKELLEINQVKQGQLHYDLREYELVDIISNAIARYRFINAERVIKFEVSEKSLHVKVIGDDAKLLQLITALLNNADKFSLIQFPIIVRLRTTTKQLIIEIEDKGYGIARQDLAHVFEGFYKGENYYTQGLGVGLLLAKYIVQFHHGTIGLISKKNKGTLARVILPRAK